MPDQLREFAGQAQRPSWEAERQFLRRVLATILAVQMVLFLMMASLYVYAANSRRTAHRDVLVGRENGYKTRALSCYMIGGQGRRLPELCSDPRVVKYLPKGQ
jgi:hypothetical protein